MTNEELAVRIQAGERELMTELWEQVRRFVAKMAARRFLLSNGYGGVELDDLIQSGYLALCEAVERFEPEREYKITSYLGNCLKTAFADAEGRRSDRQRMDPLHHAASLDAPASEDPDGDTLLDLQTDPVDAFEDLERRIWNGQARAMLAKYLDALSEDERAVLILRYYKCRTREQIAVYKGVSPVDVRCLEEKAMRKLRNGRARADLRSLLGDTTPYYARVGARQFNTTGESSVEVAVFHRERANIGA